VEVKMPTATVSSKGQVTIPKEVRKALRIDAGDRVSFLVRDDGVVELRPETVDLNDLYGMLRHEGEPATVEEMNEEIAKAAVESFEESVKK
jgi:AbrB family looped-hinge helix DNA binding protein